MVEKKNSVDEKNLNCSERHSLADGQQARIWRFQRQTRKYAFGWFSWLENSLWRLCGGYEDGVCLQCQCKEGYFEVCTTWSMDQNVGRSCHSNHIGDTPRTSSKLLRITWGILLWKTERSSSSETNSLFLRFNIESYHTALRAKDRDSGYSHGCTEEDPPWRVFARSTGFRHLSVIVLDSKILLNKKWAEIYKIRCSDDVQWSDVVTKKQICLRRSPRLHPRRQDVKTLLFLLTLYNASWTEARSNMRGP